MAGNNRQKLLILKLVTKNKTKQVHTSTLAFPERKMKGMQLQWLFSDKLTESPHTGLGLCMKIPLGTLTVVTLIGNHQRFPYTAS